MKPIYVSDSKRFKKELKEEFDKPNSNSSLTAKLEPNEDLKTIIAAGPFMANGSILTGQLELLIDVVKAKNAHILILVIDLLME